MKHEVMVIGGGTGGLRAGIISAKTGYDTALVEPGDIGGTCLNTGCIPTKALLHAAEAYNSTKKFSELGIHVDNVSFDFNEVMGRMRGIVTKGRTHAEESVEKTENLTLYKEKAKFIGDKKVKAGDEEIEADKIIIATGSSPWVPPIDGLDEAGYLDNASFLQLEDFPESMTFIGGGYISCELACFIASLGCKVTIVERMERILGVLDEEAAEVVREGLEGLGISIETQRDIKGIEGKNGERIKVKTSSLAEGEDKDFESTHLFVSTGRRPNTDLDLENTGVDFGKRGIEVNEHLRTSNPDVYAIGDVNGKAPFAHAAKREAQVALENALLDKDSTIRHDVIPWAVFTTPSVGGVGMTEEKAEEEGRETGVMKGKFSRVGKAKVIDKTEGFAKVVYDKNTRDVLGCTIVGEQAHNLIHELALLMHTPNPKIDYLLETVHVHPTLSEVMTELRES